MRIVTHKILISLLMLWALALPQALEASNSEPTFELVLPVRMVAGDPFQIVFVLNNSTKGGDCSMPTPNGIKVLYGPATSVSSSTSIVNGKVSTSQTKTYTYTLLADTEGTYTIPEATVQVGSTTYRTKAKSIKVLAPSSSQTQGNNNAEREGGRSTSVSKDDFFVVATPSKTTVYEQEALLVTFKLYSKHGQIGLPSVKLPEFEGFVKKEIDLGSLQLDFESYKGENYYTVNFYQVLLFPQTSGTLSIPKGSFEITAQVPVNSPRRSFFDDFFNQYQEVRTTVTSPAVHINVKPLPSPRPANFSGAVGQFTIEGSVPSKVLKTNESFTYGIEVKGTGNLSLVSVPKPQFPEGFEEYDPQEQDQLQPTANGFSGTRKKEFFAVPRYTGDYTIPAITFSYFNPTTHQYQEATLPQVRLHIDKGEGGETIATTGTLGGKEVKYLGQDIRYIKGKKGAPMLSVPNYTTYALAHIVVIIIGALLLYFNRIRLANNIDNAHNRRRKAGKMVRKHLRLAQQLLGSGDDKAYYEALLNGLNNYLSDKFHIPLSQLSKDNIRERMSSAGTPDTLVTQAIELLQELELALYAPNEGTEKKERFYTATSDVIEQIQRAKLKL